MQCSTCQKEFGIYAYVTMPLLNSSMCMNCWTIGEEMYLQLVNATIKNGGHNA